MQKLTDISLNEEDWEILCKKIECSSLVSANDDFVRRGGRESSKSKVRKFPPVTFIESYLKRRNLKRYYDNVPNISQREAQPEIMRTNYQIIPETIIDGQLLGSSGQLQNGTRPMDLNRTF